MERLGHERLWATPWPQADPSLLEQETFELVVQVNGRVRGRIEFRSTCPKTSSSRARRSFRACKAI